MRPFSRGEMERRIADLRQAMRDQKVDCIIATSYTSFYYLTGAPIHPFGRPMCAIVPLSSDPAIIESILEEEHTKHQSWIQDIRTYYDFNVTQSYEDPKPPLRSLMILLKDVLEERGLGDAQIGIEEATLPVGSMAALQSMVPKASFTGTSALLARQRMRKSQEELHLIRMADEIADFGQALLISELRPGRSAFELTMIVRTAMVQEILRKHPEMPFHLRVGCGLSSNWKSAGHSEWITWGPDDQVQHNQLLETIFWVWLWGYMGNVERAVFVGNPSEEVRRYFDCIIEANEAAIKAIRPGVQLSDVDRIAKGILAKHGFLTRTGSGVGRGIISHEANARELDMDVRLYSDVVLQPNMAFSLEPDLLVPGIGTFRHCNTIIVTESGCEVDSRISRGMIAV
jgi:Xaa-Pro aminopeptidase